MFKKKLKSFLEIIKNYKLKTIIFFYIELSKKLNLKTFFKILYLKLFTYSKIGKNIIIENNFHITPFAKISIGSNVYLGHNAVIESKFYKKNKLGIIIGNNVWISRDIHIQNSDLIKIEDNVLIGEFVSIRTNKHSTYSGLPIKNQEMMVGNIIIEKNVWIGRGVLIEGNKKGLIIGENSIIGANSFVKSSVPKNSIFAGNPAKLVKKRN